MSNGPILTDKKKDVLYGEYDGSRQAEYDHREKIRENTEGVLYDLQYLFNHIETEELEKLFWDDFETDEIEPTLASYKSTPRDSGGVLGFVPDEFFSVHYDEEGNPRDPEYNPDAKTKWQKLLDETIGTKKANPTMQKTLVDCIAFLCRAAESGRLDIHDVVERGVERYYRGHPEKDREIANLNTYKEEDYKGQIIANHKGVEYPDDIPDMGRGALRLLAREECEV